MPSRCSAALILLVVVGCSEPSAPCPTDQQLLGRFTAQGPHFKALAANPDDETAKKALAAR